jgi:prepilin-type N-terminal cleavage/methylation domain-containing protein/prepilin-type processing-associated H-X9-DG protein
LRRGRRLSSRPSLHGFTLIELLVVVAIIALLLTILAPSLSRARELARAAICMTNTRHLGQGILFYAADYDGYILPHDYRDHNYGQPSWSPRNWHKYLVDRNFGYLDGSQDLVGNSTIYRPDMDRLICPSSDYARERDNISHYAKGLCYTANARVMVQYWGPHSSKLNKIPRLRDYDRPSEKLLLAERDPRLGADFGHPNVATRPGDGKFPLPDMEPRHGDLDHMNVLYLDWHVTREPFERVALDPAPW